MNIIPPLVPISETDKSYWGPAGFDSDLTWSRCWPGQARTGEPVLSVQRHNLQSTHRAPPAGEDSRDVVVEPAVRAAGHAGPGGWPGHQGGRTVWAGLPGSQWQGGSV